MEKKIDFEKLQSGDTKTKYALAKELLQTSEVSPVELYPYFGNFITLLDDSNNIIKWTAIDIIGNLAVVDQDKKIDQEVMDKLYDLLQDDKLITCNHAIYAFGIIAQHRPEYKPEIIKRLLLVPDNNFETDECEAIVTGKVLEALTPFIEEIKNEKEVRLFVKAATDSPRNSTKRKATELLNEIGK